MQAPRPSPGRRWNHWQTSLVAQQYLSPAAAAQGFTLLRVPRPEREAFFDFVSLLLAHGRCLQHDPATPSEAVTHAWNLWRTGTRKLAAYLDRLAQDKSGTVPPEWQALLDLMGEADVQ